MHVPRWNSESGVHNQGENKDRGGGHSLRKTSRQRGNTAEDHGHSQNAHENEQEEDEEVAGFATQIGHEVEDEVEEDGRYDLVG